jgi:hypothetical protein
VVEVDGGAEEGLMEVDQNLIVIHRWGVLRNRFDERNQGILRLLRTEASFKRYGYPIIPKKHKPFISRATNVGRGQTFTNVSEGSLVIGNQSGMTEIGAEGEEI